MIRHCFKSFTLANLGATTALKAHALAQELSAISTKVLTAARALATTVTSLFSLANIKATATAIASSSANFLLALSTKAVASGYLLAKAAAMAFCAIPMSWVLIGIGAALAAVVISLSKASKHTANLSDKMSNLRQKGDELRQTDKLRMERLQQLAEKQKLSTTEMAEAESLTKKLTSKYGDFGASIDKVAGKLNLATDAQDKFNEAMKKASLAEIDAEIAELQANISELEKENQSLMSFWNHNLISQISGRQSQSIGQLEVNGEKAVAYRKEINALNIRKKAINGGDVEAITNTKNAPSTAENVESENQRKRSSQDEYDSAENRVAQIEKSLSRERQSELQNEIDDIRNLQEEYKSLVNNMLDFEKSKADNLQDKKKIAELESKLIEADKIAEERIATAQEKATQKFQKEVADLENQFTENAKNIQNRRDEKKNDNLVESTLKSDKDAGIIMLQAMILEYKQAAELAKLQFKKELEDAQVDNHISDDERQRISQAQEAYNRAENLFDKYQDKLNDAQVGTQQAAENIKPQGTFLAKALDGLSYNSEAIRTAKATETIASNTKKTNYYLSKNGTLCFT